MSENKNTSLHTGYVHLYYGDGKGKTTAAVGLAIRSAGAGKKVLFYQFLKDNSSSERVILEKIPEITCINGPEQIKFIMNMTPEEKEENKQINDDMLRQIIERSKKYDVVILDEILYAIDMKQLSEEAVFDFIEHRPEGMELVFTGRNPSDRMKAYADYCSHICKEKHPFDRGVNARRGIEY